MLIILEGLDKCGKTTLANYIVEKYNFKYIHFGQPKKNAFDEYMEFLNEITKDENYVIDRFHLGEPTYGVVYRKKSSINKGQLAKIEKRINELDGILIYCYDSVDNIEKRFIEDKEDFTKKEDIEKLLQLYKEQLKRSKLLYYYHVIGTKDMTKNEILNEIIK